MNAACKLSNLLPPSYLAVAVVASAVCLIHFVYFWGVCSRGGLNLNYYDMHPLQFKLFFVAHLNFGSTLLQIQ